MTHYSTYTPQQAHNDITALFDAYYDAKKAGASIPPNRRIESADNIVEQYVEANGKRPPASVLSRLATLLLLDTLTDSHPDKMARDEYPIMSYGQTGRYFERNGALKDEPYDHSAVVGYLPGVDSENSQTREAILVTETDEQKASEWRLFIEGVLTDREAFIVRRLYEDGATQAEVAEDLGVSRQRVGVIMSRVYDKLRDIITI